MPRHLIGNFQGGELDPLMSGRVDTDNYKAGLEICENFYAMATGPLIKRGGFEYIRDAAPSASWLTPFSFSITQEYVIEWSDLKARFFTNGGRVETAPNVPYELAVPYLASDAPALSYQQSYDRLYLAHPAYAPASIVRTSAVTFTFGNINATQGPFADGNSDETSTVLASAVTGTGITITASKPIFLPGHVGSLFRIEAHTSNLIPAWEPGMGPVHEGDGCRSDGKVYMAHPYELIPGSGGITGTVQPTHNEGTEIDGLGKTDVNSKGPYGVGWEYLHDGVGIVRITAVAAGGLSATADVVRRVPGMATTTPAWRWNFAAWSAAVGWPSLVTLWAGRLTYIKDFDIVASVAGDYGGGNVNFQTATTSGTMPADLSFRRRLATSDPPLWIVADRKLILGTAKRELAVDAINPQAPISGTNIDAEPQSFYGSEPVNPVQMGTHTVFVEHGGRRLRSDDYDYTRDRYAATDLTIAARHVTRSNIAQLAYQSHPWPMLIAVRGDGQLAVHADTTDNIKGFSRMLLGGGARALSAVSVFGADVSRDDLWLLIERTRADGVHREIWRQVGWRMAGEDIATSFYVDGGTMITAAAGQTHFTGFTHLAGQQVAVLAAGGVVPGLSVSATGVLDLPATAVPNVAYTLVVGLPFTARAMTLQPEFGTSLYGGSIQGLVKRARKAMLRLVESLGLKVGGTAEGDPLEEVIDRAASDYMDQPIPLFSGDTQGLIDTQYDRTGRVTIVSDVPLPAIITAAMLSVDVDKADV